MYTVGPATIRPNDTSHQTNISHKTQIYETTLGITAFMVWSAPQGGNGIISSSDIVILFCLPHICGSYPLPSSADQVSVDDVAILYETSNRNLKVSQMIQIELPGVPPLSVSIWVI